MGTTTVDISGASLKLGAGETPSDAATVRAALGNLWAYLASDQASITSNVTLADVSGLAVALLANTTYSGTITMVYDTGATPDAKFGLTVPASTTGTWSGGAVRNTADTAANFTAQSIATAYSVGGVAAGTVVVARFDVTIITSATAGNLQVQAAQDTTSATALIVKAGSKIELRAVA